MDIPTSIHKCRPIEQQKFDKLAGMAILARGLFFSTFDKWVKSNIWKFIHALNTAHKILERYCIAGELFL